MSSLEPRVLRCRVEFDYDWERDDGVVRGLGTEEQHLPESGTVTIYGELNLILGADGVRYEFGLPDLADGLNEEFVTLAAALRECCRSDTVHHADYYKGVKMRREGSELRIWSESWFLPERNTWMTFGDDPTIFSVPLADMVDEFYRAASTYHDRIAAAIGSWGIRAMAPFKAFLQECEADTRRALPG